MTWKPTDEMKEIAIKLLTDFHRKTSYAPNVEAAELLAAVQPLIAEEAEASLKAKFEVAQKVISELRIQRDLLGQANDALVSVMRQASATALEEAARWFEARPNWSLGSVENAAAIRSLIPKPPEGT